ncbi:hypothetical protein EBT25_00160 [bacterium]|nr:hypothetical protein [bacterium]
MASSSTNKQPAMIDRPFLNSTLLTVASGQLFSTSLIPTAVGNATNVLDVDSSLTDTSISGAYLDEIWLRYSKERNIFLDAATPGSGTYSQTGTTSVVVTLANHNLKVGQSVYLDYTSGTAVDETATVTAITSTTFTVTSAGTLTTTGNVNVYQPIDICFYLVGASSITNTNQFFPLFTVSVPAIAANQTYSLTLNEVLPLINHPVPHAGDNFGSANNEVSPKTRGLVMERGQALYAAVSGTTALTNGFYICVQGGFY